MNSQEKLVNSMNGIFTYSLILLTNNSNVYRFISIYLHSCKYMLIIKIYQSSSINAICDNSQILKVVLNYCQIASTEWCANSHISIAYHLLVYWLVGWFLLHANIYWVI